MAPSPSPSPSPFLSFPDMWPPILSASPPPLLERGDVIAIANATSSTESLAWVNYVDTAILSLTILGAGMILASTTILEFKGRPSTTRMRIVQSLVLSDLMLGIVGIIGSGIELSGVGLHQGTSTCDGLGFMLVSVLMTEHLWTLSLAIATFLILIYPLHALTLLLEKRWYFLWLIVWIISVTVALIGILVFGYYPSGGICYYGSNAGLYGELIQFIPRGIVFVVITVAYAKLFVFLRRPDKIRGSFSDSPSGSSNGATSSTNRRRGLSALLRKSRGDVPAPMQAGMPTPTSSPPPPPPPPALTEKTVRLDSPIPQTVEGLAPLSPLAEEPMSPKCITPTSTPAEPAEIPPWEKLELPVFQVDGQRFGGPAHTSREGLWGNWKGLSGRESRKRPSTGSSTMSQYLGGSTRLGSTSTGKDTLVPSTPPTPGTASGKVPSHPSIVLSSSPGSFFPAKLDTIVSIDDQPHAFYDRQRRDTDLSTSFASSDSDRERLRKASAVSALSALTSSDHSSHLATPIGPEYDAAIRRTSASAYSEMDGSRRSSIVTEGKKSPGIHRSLSDPESDDIERGAGGAGPEEDEDEDEQFDLMRILQQTSPKGVDDRFVAHETVEYVPESMSSYLNRKTALLMLWFPLGYVLLFSVSLIRIIYDFAGSPPPVLRAISRWFIFSQGILDALIYGLVEWHTKRVVRKRVRKGTFSPANSSRGGGGSNIGSALRGWRGGHSKPTGSGGANQLQSLQSQHSQAVSQVASQHSRMAPTASMGRIDDHPSILQQLDAVGDIRKGSVTTTTTTSGDSSREA